MSLPLTRRALLLAATAIAAPSPAGARRDPTPAIGYLSFEAIERVSLYLAAFRKGLAEIGHVEGQNLAIDYRSAEARYDRLPALAAALVSRQVAAIATLGGPHVALAAKNASSTIPIVFVVGGDPVAEGLVASLARPGGNLTGVTFLSHELDPKRLELLSELVPQARVIALLVDPNDRVFSERKIRLLKAAAQAKGVQLLVVKAGTASEIDAAFAAFGPLHAEALVVADQPFFSARREQLVALAARYAVPAIYYLRAFTASGGLISYSGSLTGAARLQGEYVGRILKGEKPADLPVQQSSKVELVINLKTAQALGLTVPQSLLARADEVIE